MGQENSGGDTFQEIQDLVAAQRWDEALQKLKAQPVSTYQYFNLGTLYLKKGEPGPATAYLEIAHRAKPDQEEILRNLMIAKKQLQQNLGESQINPSSRFYEKALETPWAGWVSPGIALLCLIAFWKTKSKVIWCALGSLLIVALLWNHGTFSRSSAFATQDLVVRSGPGNDYLQLQSLSAGTQLRTIRAQTFWTLVQINTAGDQGWVPNQSLTSCNSTSLCDN
jgi:hypothetical protein